MVFEHGKQEANPTEHVSNENSHQSIWAFLFGIQTIHNNHKIRIVVRVAVMQLVPSLVYFSLYTFGSTQTKQQLLKALKICCSKE